MTLRQPPSIDALGGGGFRVSGQRIEGSLLILCDQAHAWPADSLASLTPADFSAVIDAGREAVEFVLLGTGSVLAPPPKAVREALQALAIGLEVMDTPAAARLYNVLASDGRRVAACLIAV